MAKTTTVLNVSCDFALAEAVEHYAQSLNIQRADAMRMVLRSAMGITDDNAKPRPPLPWVKVEDGKDTVLMLDCGPNCWATVRLRSGSYPKLIIEQPGQEPLQRHMCCSPDEYGVYLAESIVIERFPNAFGMTTLPATNIPAPSPVAKPAPINGRPILELVCEPSCMDVTHLLMSRTFTYSFSNRDPQKFPVQPPRAQPISSTVDFDIIEAMDDYCDMTGIIRSEAIRRALWHVYGKGQQGAQRPALQWKKVKSEIAGEHRWTVEIGDGRAAHLVTAENMSTLTFHEPGVAEVKKPIGGSYTYLFWRATGRLLKHWPDVDTALRNYANGGKPIPKEEPGHWAADLENILKAA